MCLLFEKRGVLDGGSFSGSKQPWLCHTVKPCFALGLI